MLASSNPFSWPLELRAIALFVALVSWSSVVFPYQYPVYVKDVPRGLAAELIAHNDGPVPVNLVIELTAATNTGFSPAVLGSKYHHFLPPHSSRKITTAVPLKRGRSSTFAYRLSHAFGDSRSAPDLSYVYRLPFADGNRGIFRAYSGQGSRTAGHEHANTVELLLPIGTPIVAAREGLVIDARGLQGLPDGDRHSDVGNFVSIMHPDGAWATYVWLQDGSVSVKPGDRVEVGQQIALSGKNPNGHESYLLFSVVRNFVGLTLRSLPFKMKSVGHPSFDSTNFSGPVSPNLHPMYVVQAPTDSVWNPPEHVMPTPKVHDWSHDETLSPTQRQAVFRQRTLDAVGGDAPASSVPIIAIAFVTIFVGLVGTVAASVSHATGRPAGIRGAFWSLLKSRNTLGSDADSASPFGAMASVAVHTSTLDHSRDRGLTALPQPVPSSRTALFGFPDAVPAVPHSSSPTSSEGSAPLPAAYELGEDVEPCVGVPVVGASPSLDSAVEARHSRPDQGRPLPKLHVVRPNVSFMSGHHAKLLSMLGDVCPPTVLPTFAVSVERLGLASAGSELPDVDFALVDSQSAELIGCVVLAGPEHGALVDLLTQAGLCTVLLSPTELPERKTLLALVADLI